MQRNPQDPNPLSAMKSVQFISAEIAELPLTVYYDHSCQVCRAEVDHLAARDVGGALRWIDCSAETFDDQNLPIQRDALKAAIHAQDAQGRWLKGAEVFIVSYRAVGFVRLSTSMQRFKPWMEWFYPHVIAQRRWLARLGVVRVFNALTRRTLTASAAKAAEAGKACAEGRCDVRSNVR